MGSFSFSSFPSEFLSEVEEEGKSSTHPSRLLKAEEARIERGCLLGEVKTRTEMTDEFADFLEGGAQAALYGAIPRYPGVSRKFRKKPTSSHHRLVRDLHDWLCRRPPNARHIGTTSLDQCQSREIN